MYFDAAEALAKVVPVVILIPNPDAVASLRGLVPLALLATSIAFVVAPEFAPIWKLSFVLLPSNKLIVLNFDPFASLVISSKRCVTSD